MAGLTLVSVLLAAYGILGLAYVRQSVFQSRKNSVDFPLLGFALI